MTALLPYFFDEAQRASAARQLGDREQALTFTLDDLNWLSTVYLPSEAQRKAHAQPMEVDRLLLTANGATDIPLAGAFVMSRADNGGVTLYTPWRGLTQYADMDTLKAALGDWWAEPDSKRELIRFMSLQQRRDLTQNRTPDIATQAVEGAVFEDQQRILEYNQAHDRQLLLDELQATPTLQQMLDECLSAALLKPFPELDQRLTRMTQPLTIAGTRQASASLALANAVLQFYLNNSWPVGPIRFSHPHHSVSSTGDDLAWRHAIEQISQHLTPLLHRQIEAFWDTSSDQVQTRAERFAEVMRTSYDMQLLLKRQQGELTVERYLQLIDSGQADGALRVETVRVKIPENPDIELSTTLMVADHQQLKFLYTPCKGLENTDDLGVAQRLVFSRLDKDAPDDLLLGCLSLDERHTVLSLPATERVIRGEPISGPVFAHLMATVRRKQRHNLSHALSRYRQGNGELDPHALVDKALDARCLIDARLLTADAGGRWSTHMDLRSHSHPALGLAKARMTQLADERRGLELRLQQLPAIPLTTHTAAQAQSILDTSLLSLKTAFTHAASTALHSELRLLTATGMLAPTEQAMIKTVLDAPVRKQRAALNGFVPDVFSLAVQAGTATGLLKLASCFVLTERGGLDPKHSGKAILWTPALGFEAFAALKPLQQALERRLQHEDERATLLENLNRSARADHRTYKLAPLQQVDDHFLAQVHASDVCLEDACLESALSTPLPDSAKTHLLDQVALRRPMSGLQRAEDLALALVTRHTLPAWLANAPIAGQVLHAELLQQYLNHVTDDLDYLSGVRSLPRTTHHELKKQLKTDGFDVDPDQVQITIEGRPTAAAIRQPLTELALTHLKDLEGVKLKLTALDHRAIPEKMDEPYIKNLIRTLKPGEHQRALLDAAFADTQPEAAERRRRFHAQVPWQLLLYAHGEKLQERLSENGFNLIRQIMDMPDAIARAAVGGAQAIIRPLELLGIKAAQALKVPGIYLIGSATDRAAPRVLLAPYSRHAVREYASETHLLTALKSAGALSEWVTLHTPLVDRPLLQEWLVPKRRTARDTHTSGRHRATEVTLACNPLEGNALVHLFKDNIGLLGRLLGCQSNHDHRSTWSVVKQVLGEDLLQASSFLTGKLAYPITVWRSYRSLKLSADELQAHHWSAALRTLLTGIAQLASLRQSLPGQTESATPAPAQPQAMDFTAPDRTRLQRYEDRALDLGSLTHNANLGLYAHATTKQQYAPVDGKVYPVTPRGEHWRIGDAKNLGPRVRQNASKQWILDRNTQRRGSLADRLETAISVWSNMDVEARGMRRIRQLFPNKARQIEEALDLATTYAWNSFRNLQLLKAPGDTITPVHQLIMDFIDVPAVTLAHVKPLQKVVGEVFAALLDPTLRKPDAKRFVVGQLLEGATDAIAFTVPEDLKKAIYLAEKFFNPNFGFYRQHLTDGAFAINTHARAAALIHELSHINCRTEDISYLDTGRPFVDLISDATAQGSLLKSSLTDVQNTALSIKTPYTRLFANPDPDTGVWEDVGSTTFENTDRAKAIILRLTGDVNLSGARETFKKDSLKRLAVQLANADSVAWLMCNLGRQLHVVTP